MSDVKFRVGDIVRFSRSVQKNQVNDTIVSNFGNDFRVRAVDPQEELLFLEHKDSGKMLSGGWHISRFHKAIKEELLTKE